MRLVAEKHRFELIHHGHQITVMISNKFRNKLKGLCGNFDGESYNEFITPQNCITSDREQFIASYGFLNKTITEIIPTTDCYKQNYLSGTIVNEEEVNKYIDKKRKINYEETIKKRLLKEMIEASTAYSL